MDDKAKDVMNIQEHMLAVRDGWIALAPIAERMGYDWDNPYDQWDCISEGVFQGFIEETIKIIGLAVKTSKFARTGWRYSSYQNMNFVCLANKQPLHIFTHFDKKDSLFDMCCFVVVDENLNPISEKEIPLNQCKFSAAIQTVSGLQFYEEIECD